MANKKKSDTNETWFTRTSDTYKAFEKEYNINKKIREEREAAKKVEDEYQKKILDGIKKKQKLEREHHDIVEDVVDLNKDLERELKSGISLTRKQAQIEKAVLDSLIAKHDKEKESGRYNKEQFDKEKDMMETIRSEEMDLEQIRELQKTQGSELGDEMQAYLKQKENLLSTEAASNSMLEAADGLTGGMASSAIDMIGSFSKIGVGATLIAAGLTAAVMILVEFSEKLDTIGEEFGAVLDNSNGLTTNLLDAEAQAQKVGLGMEEVVEATEALADEFGYSQAEAAKLSASIIDTSVALGISVDEAASFVGIMSTIGGLTEQTSQDLAKQVFLLGQAEGVAPQAVLADIADSAEDVAKFTDGTGENIARAAMQARKFGMELDDVTSSAESLLDYSTALENALTASVITGKQFNIQKLQELTLAGDLEGAQKEQHRILKDIGFAELDNVIAKEAAADALGLSVENAAKMVSKTEEAVTLAGELAGQKGFEELVGPDALSNMAEMMNSLKSVAAVLVTVLGPPLNFIMGIFGETAKVIGFLTEKLTGSIPAMMLVGTAALVLGRKLVMSAIAGIWAGLQSIMKIPIIGIPLALTMGIGAVSQVMKSIGATKGIGLAEGGLVQASPGGMQATIGEGGESELVTPLSKVGDIMDMAPVIAAISSLKSEIKEMKGEVKRGNNKQLSTVISNKQLKIVQTDANASFG
jgi:hypothetical protein